MKRVLILFIISLGLTGCRQKEGIKDALPKELMNREWFFYDETIGEHEIMRFKEDGSYSYHCACGEPIGDSDLYESYRYDSDEGIIELLTAKGRCVSKLELIRYNERHMLLDVDGEIKDFLPVEVDTNSDFWMYEGEAYLKDYESHCAIVEIQEDGTVICGPIGYDREGLYENGPFETYKTAEDISYAELSITSYMSVQDDYEYEERYDVNYSELDLQKAQETTESGAAIALLWFDDQMQVEKLVFFGQLSISESVEVEDF